ncbi:hypothetical protein [Demequina sp. NBRC 110054]|uniref:hypothetical protein n=1 Tax=Demequina sp. NBRC 110054 TaxID=1570343 RepID=UPI0009FCE7A2|nr:hypothetical protein [Demequina sp. NBRC 110054]
MKWAGLTATAVTAAAMIAGALAVPALAADGSGVTIDDSGITLPAGDTFLDGGTIAVSGSQGTYGYTFDADCIDSDSGSCAGETHELAQYIGESFVPWSALGISGDFCITWVNLSLYDGAIYTDTTDSRCVGSDAVVGTDPTGEVLATGDEAATETATAATAADAEPSYTG